MYDYTLVVTSYGRHSLLRETLESFSKCADIAPINTIIIEDGQTTKPDWLDYIKGLGNVNWINNFQRRGQTFSIDKAYNLVQTPFIFHCENDWKFYRTGFIKESFDILDKHSNISMVSIRGKSEHATEIVPEFDFPIRIKWNGWEGISFNCGARRLSDYKRIGSYGQHVGYTLDCKEHGISLLYANLGYRMASIEAACVHIGDNDKSDWASVNTIPKVLVAFQVCHKYHVGNLPHENYDKHNHYDPNDQIQACRDTWANDLAKFGVDYKFFYGNGTRQPEADEVFLDVPDDYRSLSKKIRAICKWALENGYEYMFKCDDDTFVWSDRLLDSDFYGKDCVGYDWGGFVGGFACWLSKKAMEAIANAPDTTEPADDVWVGKVLGNLGVKITHDTRYHPNSENKFVKIENIPLEHPYIAIHACDADTIRELYERKVLFGYINTNNTGFVEIDKSFEDELDDIMGGLEI